MPKKLFILILLASFASQAYAQPALTVPQGGTGWSAFLAGYIPFGGTTLRLATSTNLFYSTVLNQLQLLNLFSTNATTTHATTTNLHVSNKLNFNGVSGSTWASFCTAITGGSSLCDGNDATGSGGAAAVATSTNETSGRLAYWTTTNGTPAQLGDVATTTVTATSPLSLSNTVWKIGGSNSVLSIATTTNSLFSGTLGQVLGYTNLGWVGVSTTTIPLLGDVTGTLAATVVGDDSHAHTGTTLSGIDISDDTNLTGGAGLTLTGDDMACDTASGSVFGCLSATDWGIFNNKISSSSLSGASVISYTGSTGVITTTGGTFGAGNYVFPTDVTVTGNSTTTNASFTKASTTKLWVDNLKSCDTIDTDVNGFLTCGTDAQGAGGGGNSKFATSTGVASNAIYPNGGVSTSVGVGTTTPRWALQVASSTRPQLTLSDPSSVNNTHWTQRNAGGDLFFATASPTTFATATQAMFSITGSNSSVHFGAVSCGNGGVSQTNLQGLEICGSDNTDAGGVQAIIDNNNAGANAWGGVTINNDLADNTLTHFGGLFYNSSGYTSPTFGTAIAKKNLLLLQNTDGMLSIISSTSTEALAPAGINFLTGGTTEGPTGTGNERLKITFDGYTGFGTSTPKGGVVTIASSSQSQLIFSDASLGSNRWNMRNAGGFFYLSTSSPSTFATSTTPALSINTNGQPNFGYLKSCDTIDTDANGNLACGTDNSAAGGGPNSKWATSTAPLSSIFNVGTYVGIGTTTPSKSALTVSSSTRPQLTLTDGSLTASQWSFRNAGGHLYIGTSSPSTFGTSSPANITLLSTGELGIGVANPGDALEISGLTSNGGITLANGSAYVSRDSGGTRRAIMAITAGNIVNLGPTGGVTAMDLYAGLSTPIMSLLSSRAVGVGTSTPQWPFQIASSTRPQLVLTDPSSVNNNHWTQRNAGGNFYLATSSPSTFATSSIATFSIDTNGIVSLANGLSISAGGTLVIPRSTDPAISATFNLGINSTSASSSLRFFDGTEELSLYASYDRSFSFASSTLAYMGAYGASGTTTILLANPYRPQKLLSFYCKTDSGTAHVAFGTGSATTTDANCTTSGVEVNPSGSNTWTRRQNFMVDVGRITGTPSNITITATIRDQAD